MIRYSGSVWMILMAGMMTLTARAQVTLTVDHFSATYYAQVTVEDTSEVFSKGAVAIFERGNPVPIIEVTSDELAVSLHNGEALANIRELPYGEQSVIIFEDFNFDGKKDFAIENGQNSCYHGPSFQVYLSTLTGFAYSEAFTELAQNYCGMFDVDTTFRTLHTMTKDGCCWHQFSEFIVENNAPKAMHVIEEDARLLPLVTVNEQKWDGSKMVEKVSRVFDGSQTELHTVLSFPVSGKNRRVLLYLSEGTLNYVLLSGEDNVELAYPADAPQEEPAPFIYDSKAGTLSFRNEDAVYTIVNSPEKTGIWIRWKGRQTFWNAALGGLEGSLKSMPQPLPPNVKLK